MAMNDYEAKLDARRARYLKRAEAADQAAKAAHAKAREMASLIPFGQPILVGHHSEAADRRYRDRIHRTMGRAVEEWQEARHYRQKAEAVGRGGISSDDPDAIAKLREKLESCRNRQVFMRQANKVLRKHYKAGTRGDSDLAKISALMREGQEATGLPWSEGFARDMLAPDFAGRIGFADYALSNNNANIKRLEKRIAQLERNAQAETREHEIMGLCRVVENVELNRIQIIFDGKPSAEVRAVLKSRGFRWAPSQGAWQRHLNNAGRFAAHHAIKELSATD